MYRNSMKLPCIVLNAKLFAKPYETDCERLGLRSGEGRVETELRSGEDESGADLGSGEGRGEADLRSGEGASRAHTVAAYFFYLPLVRFKITCRRRLRLSSYLHAAGHNAWLVV